MLPSDGITAVLNVTVYFIFTGIGRKNETEIIFVALLQIIWGHLKAVSNTQAVYNYEQLAYTVNSRYEMSPNYL